MEFKKLFLLGWKFFIHLLVGTAYFIMLLVPVIFLNVVVHKLSQYEVDTTLQYILTGVEYFIAFTDISIYITFVLKKTIGLIRDIWGA